MQLAQAAKEKMHAPVFSLAASAAAAATTKSAGTNPIPESDTATRFFKTNPIFQLAQNSRLGHQLPTAILYQGNAFAISNTATGFDHPLYDSRVRPRCTGKERDAETALDYFGFRYMSSAQGRFTSPDEAFAGWDQHDPQSLNLYSYVQNNPLRNTDPDGRDCITATNQTQKTVTVTITSGACNGNVGAYVPGTVNTNSLTYNGTSVGYSYSPYSAGSIGGAGTVNLGPAPSDALSASAQQVLGQAGTMASDGSVIRSGALWMAQFLAMLDGAGGELEGGVVIGKMSDLDAPGGVRPGESQLDLPNLNNPKANWAQNSSKLRAAMAEGKPIRDASAEPLANGRPANNTGFLRAERNLLENHGWTLRGGYWNPPGK